MKLDSVKFGLAAAIVVAISWVICSLIVLAAPGPAMQVTGQMMHADMGMNAWRFSATGFVVGLVVWSVLAGAYAWAIAALYNRLIK
jgi:hypothetical protein